MTNLGIDVGNSYTKSSAGSLFLSRIEEGSELLDDGLEIIVDGRKYLYGSGSDIINSSRTTSDLMRVCMLAAIGESSENSVIDANVVAGLPIDQFKSFKDSLKGVIDKFKNTNIEINGKKKIINVQNSAIYPQGVAAMYAYDLEGDAILVDIGGKTVDIAHFIYINGKRKLHKYSTVYNGIYSLQAKVVDKLNKLHDGELYLEDAERFMNSDLVILGEKKDTSCLSVLYDQHVKGIINELILNYPYKTTQIYLCGGGAEVLLDSIKKQIKTVKALEHSQFANANGYKAIADSLWLVQEPVVVNINSGRGWGLL